MFYGIGGAGKTWLLKKLRTLVPDGTRLGYLDFDVTAGGKRFLLDPASALQSLRQQLMPDAPRFDLALAMLRHKQGMTEEPGLCLDVVAEVVAAHLPGAGPILKRLSKPVLARLKGTAVEHLLANVTGTQLVFELRTKTDQEIGNELLLYLAADLRESLPSHLNRAVACVVFLDTFEAVGAGFQNEEHRRLQEKWIQELAAEFDFALTVIAGQNRLTWDEADPDWADHLEQHLVGGLAEHDAREFLGGCGIEATDMQDSILATSRESSGGFHCFSLGLCADIVFAERRAGREPEAKTLRFRPQDWEMLASRFLKSLPSDAERRWIEQLALTPRFDEAAARYVFSSQHSAAQDAAWESLHNYSFVESLSSFSGWLGVRTQMRRALENQPAAQARVGQDHRLWQSYWASRSQSATDDAAALSWYHHYCLAPAEAMDSWNGLVETARTAVAPRMQDHFSLLRWIEPLELLESPPASSVGAQTLSDLGAELWKASLGSRSSNLAKAIACFEAALRVSTEQEFPQDWAMIQNNLGNTWSDVPTGGRGANLAKAIACFEAALRVRTEQEFPQDWAMTQNNLGNAWCNLPTGDRGVNLAKAIACYEAALRVRTEQEFPQGWAATQNNLGNAWCNLPTGDRGANLAKASACYEAALRVRTEQEFPQDWAMIQYNLGSAWSDVPTGDRGANLTKAIACYEAALRVRTEQEFPQDWAMTQYNLGNAWCNLPTGDRGANLAKAVACFEAALRVYTEPEFPQNWAMTQNNLGTAWSDVPTGDRGVNLAKAIACYEAALRVRTEQEFPQDWAATQNNLGIAWSDVPTGDRGANLAKAIACYEAALRVRTEQEFPQDWAMTQNNLGTAWSDVPTGDRGANLAKAIACYEAALRVYIEQEFPQEHKLVAHRLQIARADVLDGLKTEHDK
jgi:tetratricopeptide (TPR) repeat protein